MFRARTGGAVAAAPAALLVALGVLAGCVAGCSNSESAPQKQPHSGTATATVSDGVQRLTVTTGNNYRFHPSTLIVHPGKVEITLKNVLTGGSGGPPHNLRVYGLPGAYAPLIGPGDSEKVRFTAGAPGRYRMVCTIHVAQGMTGTLVVRG